MKTSELTDRSLLGWLDEEITNRLQSLAICRADQQWSSSLARANRREYWDGYESGEANGLSQMTGFLESLRNNLRLGIRCIDGEMPELGDRPWSEADADHDRNELTPVAGYVA